MSCPSGKVMIMRKSRVFQFKLSDEEYEELHQKAGDLGISASELIRERVGLGREPEPVKERPAKASVEEARPVGSTPTPSAPSASEIKRLARQRHAHLPLVVGEREVRKELDADS